MTRHSLLISALLFLCSLVFSSCCSDKTSVVWIEGETDPQTGLATQTIIVKNAPEGVDGNLWLASLHIVPGEAAGTEGMIEHFHGCFYKVTPIIRSVKDLIVKYTEKPIQRHC